MRTGRAALAALALVAACGTASERGEAEGRTSGASDAELCEHGVARSICPRCHPALAAVFQAHGDWCDEHGFQESVCPICHPERGGRPSAMTAEGSAPGEAAADGTRVRLASLELGERIGLAVERLGEPTSEVFISATARISYDAARIARVGAVVAGIVREVDVDLGAHVTAGATLARIDSASVGADRSRVVAAEARLAVTEAALARRSSLREAGIASERELQAAEGDAAAARAELAALRASLRMVGRGGASRYAVTTPIDGVVIRRDATVGSFAEPDQPLFEIVDPSVLWAEIAIPERDLGSVAAGQRVALRVEGLPDREIEGVLGYLAPEIDPHTRTALGRVSLENSEGALRANMFADARIFVPASAPLHEVPRAAVQEVRGTSIVFVRVAADLFEVRRVEVVGNRDLDVLAVRGRLDTGEEVVTTGAFLLRTETLRDSIGAGCCEGE